MKKLILVIVAVAILFTSQPALAAGRQPEPQPRNENASPDPCREQHRCRWESVEPAQPSIEPAHEPAAELIPSGPWQGQIQFGGGGGGHPQHVM